MSLLLVAISAHPGVNETVAGRRAALIPPDLRAENFAKLGGEEVVVSGYRVDERSTIGDLLSHLESAINAKTNGVLLMTDGRLVGIAQTLGDVFSVNSFLAPAFGRSVENTLTATFSKALRAYGHFRTRFEDLKYQQIIRLPLRNFNAREVEAMRTVCRDMISHENFAREFDIILSNIRKRRRPKKASTYNDVYIVDESGMHFVLGKEFHSKADSTMPPHSALCVLRNTFRFGRRFDGDRHFNVSRADNSPISACFRDCHNTPRSGQGEDHLNMFSNDFF